MSVVGVWGSARLGYCPHMTVDPRDEDGPAAPVPPAAIDVHSRGYLFVLMIAALLGIPLSIAAFGFLVVVHELEHVLWESLPDSLGFEQVPVWWPILMIGLTGVLVALAVMHLPGHGGHVPAMGLEAGATTPSAVPGILLASGASLAGGALVGPEAPLIAMGSGLALLAIRRLRIAHDATSATIIGAAGSSAAISAIFGNPLVAAVMFLEVLGLARRQLMVVVLPCLLSAGIGALLFTGLGRWTGLGIGALAIPHLEPARLDVAEIAWAIPLAAAVTIVTWLLFRVGRSTARLTHQHVFVTTVSAGLLAGVAACFYAIVTGHSPAEVALSGQATLPELAASPGSWTSGALIALVLCKGLAYAVCLGTFRGGPVFPAIFLGAAIGVLASTVLPGLSLLPALAIGLAAGVAVTGLPVTSVVLVVLLLGDAATSQMPIIIVAVVVATVVEGLLSSTVPESSPEPGH